MLKYYIICTPDCPRLKNVFDIQSMDSAKAEMLSVSTNNNHPIYNDKINNKYVQQKNYLQRGIFIGNFEKKPPVLPSST